MTNRSKPELWINVRANEPEFQAFLGASNPEEAIASARTRCEDGKGGIDAIAFNNLKDDYLADFSAKLGLPSQAGRL